MSRLEIGLLKVKMEQMAKPTFNEVTTGLTTYNPDTNKEEPLMKRYKNGEISHEFDLLIIRLRRGKMDWMIRPVQRITTYELGTMGKKRLASKRKRK